MRPSRFTRRAVFTALTTFLVIGPVGSALACGGLIAPNGTISLVRTTTLAAYHGGVEHYVTSFEFAGSGSEVGSIIPLPGVPTKVIKGGDWTLQRLAIETQSQPTDDRLFGFETAALTPKATVLLKTKIDALDITVLRGGAVAVGNWAREHGYFLPPDAPAVLDFYAQRSPIFLAARFNAKRAVEQGVQTGEGTPIHVVIPTPNPWVPLRILGLGRKPSELVEADVYLLTDVRPATLPQAVRSNGDDRQRGLIQEVSEEATPTLMADLSSDRGMGWMPEDGMWLTYLRVDESAGSLVNDLAIDASGYGHPSPVAAGLPQIDPASNLQPIMWTVMAAFVALLLVAAMDRRRWYGRVWR